MTDLHPRAPTPEAGGNPPQAWLFPPALVPAVREQTPRGHPALGASDALLAELLTTVFFAGLAYEEGERFPVRVAFAAGTDEDVVLPDGDASLGGPMLIYRWSTLGFVEPHPLSVEELVKLAVVARSGRVYTKVGVRDGALAILGLTREGINSDGDPYLKILAPRAGDLSIRCGREHLVDYERGAIVSSGEHLIFSSGVVRTALEEAASSVGLAGKAIESYVDTVRALALEMSEHGRGGILVVANEHGPVIPEQATYRTRNEPAIAELLLQLGGGPRTDDRPHAPPPSWPQLGLRRMLRGAFEAEIERCIADYAGCTAMDGATVLDRQLRMRAFGVVLPVQRDNVLLEAEDADGSVVRPFDFSTRGARHQAAATYAKLSPGSVVFVASQDGPVTCLHRAPGAEHVLVWRFGPRTSHATASKVGTRGASP